MAHISEVRSMALAVTPVPPSRLELSVSGKLPVQCFEESVIFRARFALAARTEVRPMSESPNVVASEVLTPCFGVFYRGTPD